MPEQAMKSVGDVYLRNFTEQHLKLVEMESKAHRQINRCLQRNHHGIISLQHTRYHQVMLLAFGVQIVLEKQKRTPQE
ncbi:hypothetical protein NPIL_177041 [Nephila pilipes]|uniref:Uncharacterized protein n=1 Tax=Nephila pilipes TaxID=299642 RepID=A0A8X6MSG0_NEPPI|nr:hypothetical protein NPIL_177041 [Nephila pilipes]